MSRRSSVLKTTISFVIPVLLVAGGATWFFLQLKPVQRAKDANAQIAVIPQGSGVRDISRQLKQAGLIRSRYAFEIAIGLAGLNRSLQAGTFEFSPSMSATEIARALAKGTAVKEVVLTIREGWSAREIAEYLERSGIGTAAEFLKVANVHDSRSVLPDEQYDFLAGRPADATLEGYLFPDTYRVFPTATPTDVVKKMLDTFGVKVASGLRDDAARAGRNLYDVVTLASIVEREVRTDVDRKMAADIFWRRLAAGIPLQSDATVNYVTGKSALQPSTADTEVDSPYNTYRNKGLPSGPISNPGLASITAAIRPEPNQYLYFLTDSSGAVHYGKTFEEHLENKRKFLP